MLIKAAPGDGEKEKKRGSLPRSASASAAGSASERSDTKDTIDEAAEERRL